MHDNRVLIFVFCASRIGGINSRHFTTSVRLLAAPGAVADRRRACICRRLPQTTECSPVQNPLRQFRRRRRRRRGRHNLIFGIAHALLHIRSSERAMARAHKIDNRRRRRGHSYPTRAGPPMPKHTQGQPALASPPPSEEGPQLSLACQSESPQKLFWVKMNLPKVR